MERGVLALEYHHKGYNCAQAVLTAFQDVTGLSERESLAVSGGFGGGVGGTHEELCGAVSGAVMVLSLLTPHLKENDPAGKKKTTAAAKEFRARFMERFGGLSRCGELLRADLEPPKREEIVGHCDTLIWGAVELLEEVLAERG